MARRLANPPPDKPRPPAKIGEIRQSQALLTFGIGAVVDFPLHSAMPLGLDFWPERRKCPAVHEADLEAILGKDWFQAPPVADEDHHWPSLLAASRFPRWLSCPRCHSLGMVRELSQEGEEHTAVFGSRWAFESVRGGRPRCQRVKDGRPCDGVGIPTRLLIACYHPGEVAEQDHPGHVDDFPWLDWAHSERNTDTEKDTEKGEDAPRNRRKDIVGQDHFLSLVSVGESLAIDDLVVKCSCGSSRSLAGVFSPNALSGIRRCKGWRPWLESRSDALGCNRPIKVFLRGATNLHLPVTETVISIPPVSSRLNSVIEDHVAELRRRWEDICEERAEARGSPPDLQPFVTRQVRKLREDGFDRENDFTDQDVIAIFFDRLRGRQSRQKKPQETAEGRRLAECQALRKGEVNPSGNFDAHPVPIGGHWKKWFAHLVQVHRLREVTALLGFRRITRDNPDVLSTAARYAPLSIQPMRWLPAIELRGEGLFLELEPGRLHEWENQPAVQERLRPLMEHFQKLALREEWESVRPPSARFILVHTLAHLLIRQLTLECGYSSASLRERLYVSAANEQQNCGPESEMAAFLIYTSTPDADGSLGGLVRMGETDRLFPLLTEALRQATWCSSDPICCTTSGQGTDGLNRAACHACALVPETSCERGNRFLDRGLVIPARGEDGGASFFDWSVLKEEAT